MPSFSTPAIILRRIDLGDNDLIVKLISLDKGKISVVAKSAKKSIKRFSGVLELFSAIDIVVSIRHARGLPILTEASLKHPFFKIRGNVEKTAYASYWTELISEWLEEGDEQSEIYHLFYDMLEALDKGIIPSEVLSILFQMRFMSLSGFCPNIKRCSLCKIEVDKIQNIKILFSLVNGGLVCGKCENNHLGIRFYLSKGTVKQLQWIERNDLGKASRIRFTKQGINEGLNFLESFVPYHLGKEFKSLKILRQLRNSAI